MEVLTAHSHLCCTRCCCRCVRVSLHQLHGFRTLLVGPVLALSRFSLAFSAFCFPPILVSPPAPHRPSLCIGVFCCSAPHPTPCPRSNIEIFFVVVALRFGIITDSLRQVRGAW